MQRDWYFGAEHPAPAPHLAYPEGCAALRIVLVAVPRVSRFCEHFPDGFDLHLLRRGARIPEACSKLIRRLKFTVDLVQLTVHFCRRFSLTECIH